MKKTVLVTGVAGFIGSNLAERLLSEGHKVIGIDNLAYGVKSQVPNKVDFYRKDIRSREIYKLFKKIDFVFHLAAKNCINDCQKDPVETADINVTGTVNVFKAAQEAGVKKIIYAESSALYEGSLSLPTPETDVRPESFYALSKASAMHFAQGFFKFFNLNSTALRYFCVYGPRQDYRRAIPPVFSAFIINLLRKERPVIYGSGEKRRDFIHVDDVNDFHLLCMSDKRTDGKVFNLGSGVNYSINEVYRTISDILGSSLKPRYQSDLPGEAVHTLADIREAKKMGWRPKLGIQAGLKTAVKFIESEMELGKI